MKLKMPVGRDKMLSAADFDAEPRFGCACSSVNDHYLTAQVRVVPDFGVILPFDCQCQCSYGSENEVANYGLGFNDNEW